MIAARQICTGLLLATIETWAVAESDCLSTDIRVTVTPAVDGLVEPVPDESVDDLIFDYHWRQGHNRYRLEEVNSLDSGKRTRTRVSTWDGFLWQTWFPEGRSALRYDSESQLRSLTIDCLFMFNGRDGPTFFFQDTLSEILEKYGDDIVKTSSEVGTRYIGEISNGKTQFEIILTTDNIIEKFTCFFSGADGEGVFKTDYFVTDWIDIGQSGARLPAVAVRERWIPSLESGEQSENDFILSQRMTYTRGDTLVLDCEKSWFRAPSDLAPETIIDSTDVVYHIGQRYLSANGFNLESDRPLQADDVWNIADLQLSSVESARKSDGAGIEATTDEIDQSTNVISVFSSIALCAFGVFMVLTGRRP